jgi:small subunit ribosomal protein S15
MPKKAKKLQPDKRAIKKKIIKKYKVHEKDTGSANVQVAILTERISVLTDHLKKHDNDKDARRGLLGLVSKRRKHLAYLKYHKPETYSELTEKLSLKK